MYVSVGVCAGCVCMLGGWLCVFRCELGCVSMHVGVCMCICVYVGDVPVLGYVLNVCVCVCVCVLGVWGCWLCVLGCVSMWCVYVYVC